MTAGLVVAAKNAPLGEGGLPELIPSSTAACLLRKAVHGRLGMVR